MASHSSDLPSILVVSAYELADVALEVAKDLNGCALVHCLRGAFDAVLDEARQMVASGRCDVVLSAGSNADYLRQHLNVPVVSVRVGGFDVMAALAEACAGVDRTALVLFRSIPREVGEFLQGYRIPVALHSYDSEADARAIVADLAAQGFPSLVGAGLAARCAREYGIRAVFLYSRASVLAALQEALNIVNTQRTERTARQRLASVLHHLDTGVVAVGEHGEILAANPAADRLTGVALAAVTGTSLQHALPDLDLGAALAGPSRDAERVRQIGRQQLIVRSNPILDAGRTVGAVFTLSKASDVEESFRRLRAHEKRQAHAARYTFDHIVQASPQMQQIVRRCRTLAVHSEASVLISGPSGVGKELLAQGIHNDSKRRAQRFVAVNCGALTTSLLESELFGYEAGAFTGARREGRAGLFEVANQGTVFLDEIGELPLELQTRLLRVLQEKEVTRVGSHDPISVDVRVISATHRDLGAMVADGQFRADLFYRLNVVSVEVSPLKDRPQDLELLAVQMIEAAFRHVKMEKHLRAVLKRVPAILLAHSWPGNTRELQNFAHRVAVLTIELGGPPKQAQLSDLLSISASTHSKDDLPNRRRQEELAHIERMVKACNGSHEAAAKRLGISRTTLWRKLRVRSES